MVNNSAIVESLNAERQNEYRSGGMQPAGMRTTRVSLPPIDRVDAQSNLSAPKTKRRNAEVGVKCFYMMRQMTTVTPDNGVRILFLLHCISQLHQGMREVPVVELSRQRWRVSPRVIPAAALAPEIVIAFATTLFTIPTPALAATGCYTLWAQHYAEANSMANCDVLTVACDSDVDALRDNLCTANELLDEFHEDPLHGELVDSGIFDGIVDTYPDEVVPNNGDGNLNTVVVPLCADGGDTCPGEELRCVDGTRPVYYVDPADVPDEPDLNRWLFTFQGGGSCGADLPNGGVVPVDVVPGGVDCWSKYQTKDGREQMSTTPLVGTTIKGQKRSLNAGGILNDEVGNKFNTFNRVKIDKCSFDKSTGRITRTDLTGPGRDLDPYTGGKPRNRDGLEFDLSFHGELIVEAVLEDLRTGKTVPVYEDSTETTLPWLESADLVLIAGQSGGSVGLTSRVDRMADHMASWGSTAEVLALFDARGKPGIDYESARTFGVVDQNMYDFTTGPVTCNAVSNTCLPKNDANPESGYSDSYYDGGGNSVRFNYWKHAADDSCKAWHPGFEPLRCLDATHVLYNHLETPFFMRQAQRDQNHINKGTEFATNNNYRFSVIQYRRRAVSQAVSMRDERDKSIADQDWDERVYDWAQLTQKGLGLFMPDVTKHVGLFDNEQFFSTYLKDRGIAPCISYHDALWSWANDGGDSFWVEGVDGVVGATNCP